MDTFRDFFHVSSESVVRSFVLCPRVLGNAAALAQISCADKLLPPSTLPSRYRDYYEMIKNPVSLAEVEERVNSGAYDTVDDMEVSG